MDSNYGTIAIMKIKNQKEKKNRNDRVDRDRSENNKYDSEKRNKH